jgi:hypothetical protein
LILEEHQGEASWKQFNGSNSMEAKGMENVAIQKQDGKNASQ